MNYRNFLNAHQRRDEIDTWHVIDVVDLHVASNAFIAAALDRALKYMRVVEMLHGFRA